MLRWLEVITLELLYTKANTCINKLLEMCGIDFFKISVRFRKKTRIQFQMSLVRFGSKNAVRFKSSQVKSWICIAHRRGTTSYALPFAVSRR